MTLPITTATIAATIAHQVSVRLNPSLQRRRVAYAALSSIPCYQPAPNVRIWPFQDGSALAVEDCGQAGVQWMAVKSGGLNPAKLEPSELCCRDIDAEAGW